MLERVFFGPLKEAWTRLKDPSAIELFYMFGMLAVVFLFGILPGKLTQLIDYAVAPLTQRLGGS
jgi:NADH:ubiquinone oxidoreductase subunit 4 (subunit M)